MVTTIVVPDGCVRHDDMRLAGLIALQLPLRPGIAHDHRVPRGMASRAGRQSAQGRRGPVPAACVPFHGRQHAPWLNAAQCTQRRQFRTRARPRSSSTARSARTRTPSRTCRSRSSCTRARDALRLHARLTRSRRTLLTSLTMPVVAAVQISTWSFLRVFYHVGACGALGCLHSILILASWLQATPLVIRIRRVGFSSRLVLSTDLFLQRNTRGGQFSLLVLTSLIGTASYSAYQIFQAAA
jgi:hypothetical protein